MELTGYVDSLREDLLATAAVADEETRRAATLLATALEPAARLMLIGALSDLAGEITKLLGDTAVDVTLRGRDVEISVRPDDATHAASGWGPFAFTTGMPQDQADPVNADAPDAAEGEEGDLGRAVREAGDELSRTTLRLMNHIKTQAEHAASAQGVSLNTYIQRAVATAVRGAGRRTRRTTDTAP